MPPKTLAKYAIVFIPHEMILSGGNYIKTGIFYDYNLTIDYIKFSNIWQQSNITNTSLNQPFIWNPQIGNTGLELSNQLTQNIVSSAYEEFFHIVITMYI